ncbi:MAG: two-component system response regulator [Gallionellales bacterium RIFCSPLOWO2_12_FULL_59_22]|nr:MAG: two-component system response regulator [Gallionellales bacterium RIFCSPLOWO2_02_FULL_59_110]OGT02429.1 MAG: two-component system response regulator [Gallionellales bacterium RIFCSPLOWO2_02_58_13]OGT13448.1 MAG: two-component system response regulator [Gallionellales bacterium RIFCSPLOWO2_12_FULL_59_22]
MTGNMSQTILIVEDSDDDYLATVRAFKKANLLNPVKRCTNGDQALDYLLRRGEFSDPEKAPRPNIILLDLNLPGTDGKEVLRAIKTDPDLRKIPVIVLTTSSAEKDIEQCYAAGANSYVQKPVDLVGFIQSVARLTDYWFNVSVLPKNIK